MVALLALALEVKRLRDDVPTLALKAEIGGRTVRDIGREVVALSRAGLARRSQLNRCGQDETQYLRPLDIILDRGKTEAEVLLEKFGDNLDGLFCALDMQPMGDLGCL